MHPVKFCATECTHQKSGEMSVWNMYLAWEYARNIYITAMERAATGTELASITPAFIEKLGELVEPQVNAGGFRYTPVKIGHRILPRDVVEPLKRLCEVGTNLTPVEFYKEFEEIHPFSDGNGRVGAILFNIMTGAIWDNDPVIPPNVFGDR